MRQTPFVKPRRKKTVTERQLAANRANALKSTGPKTEEGKRRSKYNALTHGLTATSTVIPSENRECYDVFRHDYSKIFTPDNVLERQAADDLCAARWRKERAVRYETAMLTEAMSKFKADIAKAYPDAPEALQAGIAWRCLVKEDATAVGLLIRYDTAMLNNAIKAWEHLMKLKCSAVPGARVEALNAGPPAPYPEWPYQKPDEALPKIEQSAEVTEKKDDPTD